MLKSLFAKFAAAAAMAALAGGPVAAQEPTEPAGTWESTPPDEAEAEAEAPAQNEWFPAEAQPAEAQPAEAQAAEAPGQQQTTIPRRDVFSAAANVFGDGAEGLAGLLERILGDQGEPIAYISGEEASGAFVLGVRYGSGTMRHRIEGDRPVYWTGPSIGFDVGADASKVFVLVYNLHDSQRLFRRFPAAEGNAYFVGGFTASYLRRGDIVLIPVRLGVGMRLGVNAGYMRFSERNRWLPF
ncbi:DUF1134 domain-containing protein [Allosphingosinicella sp.]|jgi:hypothetical protein|uniref:DUF1134 domain-containing protein n=1 Tax=Allosphingosinicella sp. TaxID=2823234 RepID=UPI002EF1ED83